MNTDNNNLKQVFRKNPELNLKIIRHLIENEGKCYITRCSGCIIPVVTGSQVCTATTAYAQAKLLIETGKIEGFELEVGEVGVYTSIWEE